MKQIGEKGLNGDVAIKAYRAERLPFPDGTIIAALHYGHIPSKENNKVFGRSQSFIAEAATNIQFMVKESKKYSATGGCGLGHFNDGKPTDEALMNSCFSVVIRPKLATLSSPATHLDT
jgi:hypothetical protein